MKYNVLTWEYWNKIIVIVVKVAAIVMNGQRFLGLDTHSATYMKWIPNVLPTGIVIAIIIIDFFAFSLVFMS